MVQVLKNIRTLYTCPAGGAADDVGPIERAAIAWSNGAIRWVGRQADLPAEYAGLPREAVHDAAEAIVIPGLIDCHTHLAFGGWRAEEFEARCRGDDYRAIARRGGGIAATVRATREASEEELLAKARGLLREMLRLGVTTIEAKSGYGLTVAKELKLLRVYRGLNELGPQRIVPTLLAAHVVPDEYRDRPAEYVRLICEELLPLVARPAAGQVLRRVRRGDRLFAGRRAADPAGRRGPRTAAQAARRPARRRRRRPPGGRAGGRLGRPLGVRQRRGHHGMARAGVVAVVLPLASLYLRQRPVDARKLVAAGVTVAVATNFNPGSAPSFHLPLAMTLACTQSGLTPGRGLAGRHHGRGPGDRTWPRSSARWSRANGPIWRVLSTPQRRALALSLHAQRLPPQVFVRGRAAW